MVDKSTELNELQPLKNTAGYEAKLRRSYNSKFVPYKLAPEPEELIYKHKHTTVAPFHLKTEAIATT